MKDLPPDKDAPDEIDDRYRRASALDASRPSGSVRRAVLEHAKRLAEERLANEAGAVKDDRIVDIGSGRRPRSARNAPARWRQPAIFGTLAAAALAGLLITPHFLDSRFTSTDAPAEAARPAPPAAATRPAPPTAAVVANAPLGTPARVPPPALAPLYVPSPAPAAPNMPAAAAPAPPNVPAAAAPASPPAQTQTAPSQAKSVARFSDAARASQAFESQAANAGAAAGPLDAASALRQAAEAGDTARARALLDDQVDIDARDAGGRTALLLAAQRGRTGMVEVLLAHGADANAADAHGNTPLRAAVAGGYAEMAAALRRAGARQ